MTAPPTSTELRLRLIALAAQAHDVPPERRLHFAQLLDRLERLRDDDLDDVWSY